MTAVALRAGIDPRTDGELLRAHHRGRGDAMAAIYQRFHDRLVRYLVKRTDNQQLAEDLAHEAILRLLGAADRFDVEAPAWPYLKIIARNLVIDHARKYSREVLTALEAEDRAAREPSRDGDPAERAALRPLIDAALRDLPDRQRAAIELRCLQGWSADDAATFLGISAGAFRQLTFRARRNLASALEEAGHSVRAALFPVILPIQDRIRGFVADLRDRGWFESGLFQLGVERAAALAIATGVTFAVVPALPGSADEPATVDSRPMVSVSSSSPERIDAATAPDLAIITTNSGAATTDTPSTDAESTAPDTTRAHEVNVTTSDVALPADGNGKATVDQGEEFGVGNQVWVETEQTGPIGTGGDVASINCDRETRVLCDLDSEAPTTP